MTIREIRRHLGSLAIGASDEQLTQEFAIAELLKNMFFAGIIDNKYSIDTCSKRCHTKNIWSVGQ